MSGFSAANTPYLQMLEMLDTCGHLLQETFCFVLVNKNIDLKKVVNIPSYFFNKTAREGHHDNYEFFLLAQ